MTSRYRVPSRAVYSAGNVRLAMAETGRVTLGRAWG